jgi:3-oxoacyl-[acyl-carrier protein] reductase
VTVSSLEGRTALVTGGSGGIGGAICDALAEAGVSVAIHYASNREPAEARRARIASAGGRAVVVQADLGDAQAVTRLASEVQDTLGGCDILIANAATRSRFDLDSMTLSSWRAALEVNLTAPFLLTQRFVPGMRERGWGRLIYIGALAAFTGGISGPAYASSKAGLAGLAHSVASAEAARGITANVISPGPIGGTGLNPDSDPDGLAARVPVGRLGRPEEVATMVLMALRVGFLTNQVIELDGGMYPR